MILAQYMAMIIAIVKYKIDNFMLKFTKRTEEPEMTFYFSIILCRTDSKNDSNILNKSAVQKPETLKPSIQLFARRIIAALITNKNRPSVKIVTGSVSTIKIGFKIENKMPTIKATQIAVP